MMSKPTAFYAEPRFRSSSPDLLKLSGVTELTLETPGAGLVLALDYYQIEVFATRNERDLACGPTAHRDIRYFPISQQAAISAGVMVENLSCGHTIDHPHFETIFNPIFDGALKRLIGDAIRAPKRKKGEIAAAVLTIARARYTISVIAEGGWLTFDVRGLCLFEQIEQDVIARTIDFLNGKLILHLSPSLWDAKRN